MYGLIHVCLQHMVKTKFGEENWKKVLVDAGLDGKSYLTFRSYPDEETLQLIVSSAKVLGFTLDEALELLGDHFLLYVMENGYEEMLRGLGSNFLDFIQNINYLHWYLMSTAYPGIVSPSFVCSPGTEEGDAPILDYYSNRMGMHPLSNGLLRAIGRDLFQMSVEFEFLEAHEEILSPTRTLYHRRFRVISKSMVETTEQNGLPEISKLSMTRPKIHNALPDAKDLAKGKALAEKLGNSFCGHMFGGGKDCPYKATPKDLAMRLPGKVAIYGTRQRQRKENGNGNNNIGGYRRKKEKTGEEGRRNYAVSVPSQLFCKMQPYHIVFDSDNLTVVQAGTRLTQFYPRLLSSPRMDSVFDLVWPLVPLTPYNLKRFRDFVFQLAAKPGGGDPEQTGGKRVAGGRMSERRSTIAEVEGIEDGRGEANGRGKGAGSEESEEADDGQPKGKRSASMGRMRHHLPPVGQPAPPRGSREEGKASREDGGRGGRIKAARDGSPSTRKSVSNSNEAEGEGVDGEGEEGGGGEKIGNKGETSANNGADRKGQPTERVLILKGAIYPMDEDSTDKKDSGLMIFVGTPLLHNLQELIEKSMRLSDVPMYDSTRELVLLKHQRSTEFDLMTRLEETTMELTSTWEALRIEKQKADSLLYSMMPREVAVLLQRGERVQQTFSECTILFSDIVTFTVIASQSSPLQIIDMLNALYTEFDALTEKNDVYKVETIGDAYMVVGGVPSPSPTHAVQVSRQAVGMVQVSGKVLSPVSGLPLEIRVGLHSGPVVAGCVGLKMPRYCLFGDTVNTASRMESHGVPGKIHISGATKRALDGSDFKLTKRGDIEVKGKGIMDTYFIELSDQPSMDENVS